MSAKIFELYKEKYLPIAHFNFKGNQIKSYGIGFNIEVDGFNKFAENIAAVLPNNN